MSYYLPHIVFPFLTGAPPFPLGKYPSANPHSAGVPGEMTYQVGSSETSPAFCMWTLREDNLVL